jgi:hypothetical protein
MNGRKNVGHSLQCINPLMTQEYRISHVQSYDGCRRHSGGAVRVLTCVLRTNLSIKVAGQVHT